MLEQDPSTLAEADAALTHPPEEPETTAVEPAVEPDGQPRDEQGRFTSAVPEAEPEAAPADQEAAPETPVEPDAATEAPEAEAEDYPEVTYRADGQDITVTGSAEGEDGIFFPAAVVPEVKQLLSAGKAAFGSVRQRLSDAAAREQAALDRATAAEAQAQHVLAHFEQMIEKSQGQPLEQSLIGQWLANVAQNWPILKAEAKAKAIELQNQQATKELERYREQDQQAKMRPLMEQTLRQSVMVHGGQAGLDEQTLGAIFQTLQAPEYQSYLFIKAPYDDPANGIRKGELVIDHGVVQSAIRLASLNRAAPQQQKIAAAQKANAQAQPVKAKIPPTVGGKGRAPKPAGVPQFSGAKEADDFLLHGDLDGLVEE